LADPPWHIDAVGGRSHHQSPEYGVSSPEFTYTSTMRALDGVTGAFDVSVAQVSQRFGAGPFRKIGIAM
ncbi:hypothetical protein, partial [Tabrizicola flagellatus]|uniref:hypothetical protein n=1 Tax=Tabrizicola flagellatus TaxID=2593021 RepID=UPI001F2604F8